MRNTGRSPLDLIQSQALRVWSQVEQVAAELQSTSQAAD